MISLGDAAQVGTLTCDTLHVKNGKTIGNDSKNVSIIQQSGSVVYFSYDEYHQLSNFKTTNTTNVVEVTFSAPHNLQGGGSGDTIYISQLTVDELNGIPKASVESTFSVHNKIDNDTIEFMAHQIASSSGTVAGALALVRIRRYKSLDLAGAGVTWVQEAHEPTASHTNRADRWFAPY